MAGQSYALLIGNGQFQECSGLQNLRCTTADVEGMARVLSDPKHGGYEVLPLIDATRDQVSRAVVNILSKATDPDDLVLIYYSGHGNVDELGNLYLATADSSNDILRVTAVAVQFIATEFKRSKSDRIVLILDCCFAGSVEAAFTRGQADEQIRTILPARLSGSGTYVLAASSDTQLAHEKECDENGLLTKHILSGIAEGLADLNDDGIISMHELKLHVQKHVAREGAQEPLGFALREKGGDLQFATTGKEPQAALRQELEQAIFAARTNHHVPVDIVTKSIRFVNKPPATQRDKDTLQELYRSRKSTGDFIQALYFLSAPNGILENDSRASNPAPTPKAEPAPTPPQPPPVKYRKFSPGLFTAFLNFFKD